jgi:hypothetical protein
MRRLLQAVVAPLALGLLLLQPQGASAQGCAMCKTALTNSEEGRWMSRQFNQAILVMMFAPYALMGAGAAYFYRARIRSFASRAVARLRSPARSAALRG